MDNNSAPHTAVICDFDGTVSLSDVSEAIFKKFAPPAWEELDRLWHRAEIGTAECLREIFAMIEAPPEELDAFFDSVPIDRFFPEFARYCRDLDIPLTIVSDGLNYYLDRILSRHGLEVPHVANELDWQEGRYHLTFPHAHESCDRCGNCKLDFLLGWRRNGWRIVYIGDGLSDCCAAAYADVVLAKRKLAEWCGREGVPYLPFKDFSDVLPAVERFHRAAPLEVRPKSLSAGQK